MTLCRVLIVDDHAGFRASARRLLEAEGFCVVAEAETGAEAVATTLRVSPDVVVLDIGLPDMDGFAVVDRLVELGCLPSVVLVSGRDPSTYGTRLAHPATRGFLPKVELSGAALAELLR